MKKLLFLYNTHAGKGLLKSRLAAVQDALAAAVSTLQSCWPSSPPWM